jgi:glutamate dehydrogenase (NAD(P)+)
MASDLGPERRNAALEDFGRKLASIIGNGIYSPGMDMNCGPDQLRAIYRGAGIGLGEITDTSWFTAMGVYHSVCAAADALGIEGRPVRLSIEGFGSVARHLADRLDPGRFELVSVATIEGAVRGPFRPSDLAQARDASGDRFVSEIDGERVTREDVLTEDVDIVLPSSRVHAITLDVAREIRAQAVVPIANAPYVDGTIEILSARGVRCLPGYVSNCGGVLASSLADQGLPVPEVEKLFADQYRRIVDGIFRVAAATQRPGTEVAEELARMHMPERARRVWRSIPQRVYDRFLKAKRPAGMKAASARADFLRSADRVLGEIAQMERQA